MAKVTKDVLAEAYAEANEVSKKDAKATVEFILNSIISEVAKGNEVSLSGFGKFYRATQKGRTGTVPGSTKQYATQDKFIPKFSAAKQFKDGVL